MKKRHPFGLQAAKLFGIHVLLLCCSTVPGPAQIAAGRVPISSCEVFTYPERFWGKRVQMRAVFVRYEHHAFVYPYPRCETAEISVAEAHSTSGNVYKSWSKAGGSKGKWMLATITGKLKRTGPGKRGRPGPTVIIESMSEVSEIQPYLEPPQTRPVTSDGLSVQQPLPR